MTVRGRGLGCWTLAQERWVADAVARAGARFADDMRAARRVHQGETGLISVAMGKLCRGRSLHTRMAG